MKSWVKVIDGQIELGPIASEDQPDGYIEYVEVINLPRDHGPVSISVEVRGGRCIKTVSAETSYSAQRRSAYPAVSDQMDMLWHAMNSDQMPRVEPFYSAIKAVKDRFPKSPTT